MRRRRARRPHRAPRCQRTASPPCRMVQPALAVTATTGAHAMDGCCPPKHGLQPTFARSPSPHEAEDHTAADERRRRAAFLLLGACRCEGTGVAHVVPGGLDPAAGTLDVCDPEFVDM